MTPADIAAMSPDTAAAALAALPPIEDEVARIAAAFDMTDFETAATLHACTRNRAALAQRAGEES